MIIHNRPKHYNNMKTITKGISMSLCILFAISLNAQDNVVKLNPLSAVFGHGNIAYERALTNSMSAQLGIFYGATNIKINETKNVYSGFGITPEFRYYMTHKDADGPEGLFIAPFGMYRNYQITLSKDTEFEDKASVSTIGGGLVLGYQAVFGEHVTMDFFAGPNYKSSKYITEGEEDPEGNGFLGGNGVGVRFGLTLGFAF